MCGGRKDGGHTSQITPHGMSRVLGAKRDRQKKPGRQELRSHTKEMLGDPRAVGHHMVRSVQ